MLNLIKKTWVDGETVNAQKMNTIRDDLNDIEEAINDLPAPTVYTDDGHGHITITGGV